MENVFLLKKKSKLIPCLIHGIKYTDFEGEDGFRILIEVEGKKLKTNRLLDITSMNAMYNKKHYKPLYEKEFESLNCGDMVYFVNNDAEFLHKLKQHCEWNSNAERYYNRIGEIINVYTFEGMKLYRVKFNNNTAFRILESCLYKLTPELKRL
jgi:hypothetical protein